MAKATLIVE